MPSSQLPWPALVSTFVLGAAEAVWSLSEPALPESEVTSTSPQEETSSRAVPMAATRPTDRIDLVRLMGSPSTRAAMVLNGEHGQVSSRK